MKSLKIEHIITGIICIAGIILTFKYIQKLGNKPVVKETYNQFNQGYGCFNNKLSVPLPGKSKCFDCEREMIARNSCNISAGALANPTLSFDATRQAQNMWGVPQFGSPSRLYSADSQLLGKVM